MAEGTFYVVGLKDLGVLFVKSNPFRAAIVTDAEIQKYSAAHPGIDGYARIAASASQVIADEQGDWAAPIDGVNALGIESLVASGVKVSNADFALVAKVDDQNWKSRRSFVVPIENALSLVGSEEDESILPTTTLQEAVLCD